MKLGNYYPTEFTEEFYDYAFKAGNKIINFKKRDLLYSEKVLYFIYNPYKTIEKKRKVCYNTSEKNRLRSFSSAELHHRQMI